MRAVVGPFLEAAINVFKTLVSVYKLVSAIVGYFRAKRETEEVKQLMNIITENLKKHYTFEKCSATEQLYEMLKILQDERAAANKKPIEKDVSEENNPETETDKINNYKDSEYCKDKDRNEDKKKLEFMKLSLNDDVNIFLSSFSQDEIEKAETFQKACENFKETPFFSLKEKILYRKYMSAINSIAVARSKESLISLLEDGIIFFFSLKIGHSFV